MILPEELKTAIEEIVAKLKPKELLALSRELSERYRQARFVLTEGHRLAYLTVRLPATFAAIAHVFLQIQKRLPSVQLSSLLDLGAGPGSGMWAFQTIFNTLQRATLFERDRGFVDLGKRLSAPISNISTRWEEKDLKSNFNFTPHDMVLFSYSIGEIDEEHWPKMLEAAWQAAQQMIVFIEPGTPAGFARIRKIRELFIGYGGHIIAPCPHQNRCPIAGSDWCHFAQRVERSSLHRMVKSATLNYEDEKFTYIAVSKQPLPEMNYQRILRHPQKRSGHVELTLCAEGEIKHKIITRKQKELYRQARDAEWGQLMKDK